MKKLAAAAIMHGSTAIATLVDLQYQDKSHHSGPGQVMKTAKGLKVHLPFSFDFLEAIP